MCFNYFDQAVSGAALPLLTRCVARRGRDELVNIHSKFRPSMAERFYQTNLPSSLGRHSRRFNGKIYIYFFRLYEGAPSDF